MRNLYSTANWLKATTAAGFALLLAGCAVTADHAERPVPAAQTVEEVTAQVAAGHEQAAVAADWWQAFGDQQLNQLIERSLANNFDLEAAALRLEAQMAWLQVSRDQLRPQGGVSGALDLSRQQRGQGLDVTRQESVALGLAADWQLDLFGRIRARVRQAEAEIENRAAFKRQALADVVSGVVATYTRLMSTEEQLAVLDKQLKLLDESVAVLQLRVDEGLSTPLELSRTRALHYEYRARRPELEVLRTQYQEALATLSGQSFADVRTQVVAVMLNPSEQMQLRIHEPETALRQAPEVQLAETRVAAAMALSDEARAALYPDISVSGVLGWLSGSNFVLGDAREQLAVRPQLNWSLLNLSALRSNLEAQGLEEQAVLAEYEKTWLQVLNRADAAIQNWQAEGARLSELDSRQTYARSAYEQARSRYEEGIIPYLDYLDAQRDQLTSEADVVEARARLLEAYINLQRAFPGHWVMPLTNRS